jgi:WD40 repeat protein
MYNALKAKQNGSFWVLAFLLLGLLGCNSRKSNPIYAPDYDLAPANRDDHLLKKHPEQAPASVTLSLLRTWELKTVSNITWHPRDPVIVIAGWDQPGAHYIRLYDIHVDQYLWEKATPARGGAITPDGNLLAHTISYDPQLQLLSIEDGHTIHSIDSDECTTGDWLLFNASGNRLLTGVGRGHINWETVLNLWDMQTNNCQRVNQFAGLLYFLDVNDDFSLVILSFMADQQYVSIWNLEKREDICKLPGSIGLFVPGTQQFIVSDADKLSFYDAFSCELLKESTIPPPHSDYIAFSSDGKLFVTAGEQLQLWETSTSDLLYYEDLPDDFVRGRGRGYPALIFNPDNKYLLAIFATRGMETSIVQVWQVLNNP